MIYVINKPKNWTSFDIVAKLKNTLGVKKIGHAGTLDPLADGVLVVLTDSDTKNQDEVMKGQKEYISEISFNLNSPTLDLEVKPRKSQNAISVQFLKENLPNVLKKYIGEIEQTVPEFSAKKLRGKPMYKIARKNLRKDTEYIEPYDLPKKKITIYSIEILNVNEKDIESENGSVMSPTARLKIVCSHGTYIRSLARDLGLALGTHAVLSALTRTRVGKYSIEDTQNIENFKS